jgi:hypothetical protein
MEAEATRGGHKVAIRDDRRRVATVELDVRYRRLTVHPPIGKQRRYSALELTAIHADERQPPRAGNRSAGGC